MFSLLKNIFKNDAYAVVALTGMIYLMAALREFSYSELFAFPYDMVDIGINNLISTFIFVFIIGYGIIRKIIIEAYYHSKKCVVGKIIKIAIIYTVLVLLFIIFLISAGYQPSAELIILFIIVSLLFNLTFEIFRYFGKEKFFMLVSNIGEISERARLADGKLVEFDRNIYYLLTIIGGFYLLMNGVFQMEAKTKNHFDVFTKNNVKYAVVKVYGDKVIANEVKDGSLIQGAIYYKIDDLSGIKFTYEKIKREDVKFKEVKVFYFLKRKYENYTLQNKDPSK